MLCHVCTIYSDVYGHAPHELRTFESLTIKPEAKKVLIQFLKLLFNTYREQQFGSQNDLREQSSVWQLLQPVKVI